MFDVDAMGLLTRELLRERTADLIARSCAWAVGLSDQPHLQRRHGTQAPSGLTLGQRAAADQPLGSDEAGRLELGEARPGSFQDALNALTPDGALYADRFDSQVLDPFVLDVCVRAAQRVRDTRPGAWVQLLDELGESEDEADLVEVVRAGEWEAPLRTEAEHLVLAALAAVPLMEVEAEGLPLSLVQAAEAMTRGAAPVAAATAPAVEDPAAIEGAVFLAGVALREARLTVPVPPAQADRLLDALLAEGLLPEEVPAVLAHLPVQPATAAEIRATVAVLGGAGS
ncbi:hypothetical protein [Goekera deserti]|uniref:hypothetical protein n=1 Tax=Goekera deserti TaxID=2497753 RepID=UPI001F3FCF7F|nr:hypothetical protein [Goekera deserti]